MNDSRCSTRPVSHLVVTWVVMVPLMFYAVAGSIRFDSHSRNNAFDASYTSLVTPVSHGLTRVVIGAVLAICAVLFCTRIRGIIDVARHSQAFIALSMLALASTAWSQFPKDSFLIGSYAAVNLCFAFYFVARVDASRQIGILTLLGWLVILTSTAAAILFPAYGTDHQGEAVFGSWIGIFPHKNWLAIMVVFLVSGAFYVEPSTRSAKTMRNLYIMVSLFVIAMSHSRTGWIVAASLLGYIAVTRFLKKCRPTDRAIVILLSILFGGVAIAVVAEYFRAIMYFLGKDPTLTGRTRIWELSFHALMQRPLLGYGYRAFWHGLEGASASISLADRWIVPAAHNGFLDLGLGIGILGVGLVLYLMAQAVRNAMICFRRGDSFSAEWFLCLVFLTLVSNVAELTLMVPNHLAWILFVVACVGLSFEAKRGPDWQSRVSRSEDATRDFRRGKRDMGLPAFAGAPFSFEVRDDLATGYRTQRGV
jgi:exopolysaccharide production protein ExoQ